MTKNTVLYINITSGRVSIWREHTGPRLYMAKSKSVNRLKAVLKKYAPTRQTSWYSVYTLTPTTKSTIGRIAFHYYPISGKGYCVTVQRDNGKTSRYPYRDKYYSWINDNTPKDSGWKAQFFTDRIILTRYMITEDHT